MLDRRTFVATCVAATGSTALHLLASIYPEHLWGAHHLKFLLPEAVLPFYLTPLVLLVPIVNRQFRRFVAAVLGACGSTVLRYAIALCVSALIFSAFPLDHHLFGYNLARLGEVAGLTEIDHRPHEYDTMFRRFVHRELGALLGWGVDRTYATISILFGVAYVGGSLAFSRLLGGSSAGAALLFCGLLSPGYLLLFFGYAEAYSSVISATLFFLLSTLAFMEGRCSIVVPVLTLAAVGLLHIMGLFVAPGLVFAAVKRYRVDRFFPPILRRHFARALCFASLLLGLWFFHLVRPFSMLPLFDRVDHLPYGILSFAHLLDMVNEQLLVALPGWIGLMLALVQRPEEANPRLQLLGVSAVVSLGMWLTVNPALGSLDWDLLAMSALPWVLFGLYAMIVRVKSEGSLGYAAAVVIGLTLTHTVPWISLQRWGDKAVLAIEAMVVNDAHTYGWRSGILGVSMISEGFHAAGKRQLERAERRSSDEAPVVLRTLAQIYLDEGRFDEVNSLLRRTLLLVPDKGTLKILRVYRERAPNGSLASIELLEYVISIHPHPTYFGILAEFYRAAERREDLFRLMDKLDRTISRTELLAAADPRDGENTMNLGALYLRRGRMREAETALDKAETTSLTAKQRASLNELRVILEKIKYRSPQEGWRR